MFVRNVLSFLSNVIYISYKGGVCMYVYRKHLRASFLNYILGMIIFLSIGLLSGFAAILSRKAKFEMIDFFILIIVAIVIFTFILIEFILLYFLFLRRFKYINVTLEEDAIIYNNSKKKIVIPYDEIIEIKYPSIRYMGGWMKIKHTNGKIRLTVVLENIGDFMYRLKEILDEGGKSNAITVSTLLSIILMIFIR